MIVHPPEISQEGGKVCISAEFEMQKPLAFLPTSLWYRFPEHYRSKVNDRVDAFAPTALLLAMFTGEDLIVRGEISPRLAYHLHEYQEIYHSWYPKLFKRVEIKFDQLAEPIRYDAARAVGTAFSGGVDSFYTVWAHLPQNQPIPEARLTHGLFIHGLDLRLEDEENYRAAAGSYEAVFKELGLELVQISTNAYQFSEFRINWTMFHGAPTIGAALLLGGWMRRFYMPSSMLSYNRLFPQGSSPLIDHLLSTEHMEVVHFGASIQRYDKLAVLSRWPVTYHRLRVCSNKQHIRGLENCSACNKCYRTLTLLDLLDALPNYANFSGRMTPLRYLKWGLLMPLNADIEVFTRNRAFQLGRVGVGLWMQVVIVLGIVQKLFRKVLTGLLGWERMFHLKRKVFIPESK